MRPHRACQATREVPPSAPVSSRRTISGVVFIVLTVMVFVVHAQTPSASATGAAPPATATPELSASPAPSATTAPKAPRPRALLDRSTPRQTVGGFLAAIDDGQPLVATRYLDLSGLQWSEHRSAAEAAEQLAVVLRRSVALELSGLPDGIDDIEKSRFRIATVEVNGRDVPVDLTRKTQGGDAQWLFAATTVFAIPELYEASQARSWLEPLLPKSMSEARYGELWGWQLVGLALAVLGALPLGLLIGALLLYLFERIVQRTDAEWDDALLGEARGPLRFAVGWLSMGVFALSLSLPQDVAVALKRVVSTPLIMATGLMLMRAVRLATLAYIESVPDDLELKTRGLRTQLVILRRLSSLVIGLITMSITLMQFEVVRSVGWSLLASAGVAGVALGFAAQKSLGAVIAGLQLSITQPLRLGDAVVVDGLWGEVEEISLTYVRVKLFDERRLVVPVEKFLTEPFENWSKPGDEMIGIIEMAVDPSLPFAELRAELERVALDHPDHDGRELKMQVTDQDDRRVLVRCRVSTNSMDRTFQLRCDIREQLLTFLQTLERGRYLPRQRWEQIDAQPEDG